jgi:hypothetical protein
VICGDVMNKISIFCEKLLVYTAIWFASVPLLAMLIGVEGGGIRVMIEIAIVMHYVSLLMFWARIKCNL